MRTIIRSFALLLAVVVLLSSPLQAQSSDPTPEMKFAVSTIKPSQSLTWISGFTPTGFAATGVSLQWLVKENAYLVYDDKRLSGQPVWMTQDKFDVEAKVEDSDLDAFHHLTLDQKQKMVKDLLAERFHLAVHRQRKRCRCTFSPLPKVGPG